ncbi:MAG: PRC-barrel domain-containing protein [Hyphomicrobiales bacterium]
MKHLLATTALVAALGTAAYADEHMGSALIDYSMQMENDLAASDLIGMRIYATEDDVATNTTVTAGDEQNWNDIGEINEIFLTAEGEVSAVILGVGGFLGLGEKDVAVDMSEIRMVNEEGDNGEFFLVINATQADLEAATAFERQDDMNDNMSDDMAAAEDNDGQRVMAMDRERFTMPVIDRDGYSQVEPTDLTAEALTGARLYGANDEDIGEVSELVLADDGTIDQVILDVGGFIGIGEKSIAVSLDELQIMRPDGGNDVRVYIDATQEQLEQQPAYTG